MTYRTWQRCFVLLGLAALFVQGCRAETAPTASPAGTRRMVWIDLSSSVTDIQRTAWLKEVEKIMAQLAAGDSILVFGMHEATLGASPLAVGHLPPPGKPTKLSDRLQVAAALRQVREESAKASQEALSGKAKAKQTDIFGALDRLRPDEKGRPTVLYFFSDMEHATREFNMEATPLEKNMPRLIQNVVERHRWDRSRLSNTQVYCILPDARGPSRVNNRLVLERFWSILFQSLGAELFGFETYLKTS
jgi:hypothetical protein